jgi:hypothetical protein
LIIYIFLYITGGNKLNKEITKYEVIPLILDACPSYLEKWNKYLAESDDEYEEGLLYLAVADFVRHFVELLSNNQREEFENIFEVIEKLHLQGDNYVKELATIGFLEDIKHSLINPDDTGLIKKYLRPESLKWWDNLDDFWCGKTGYVGGPKLNP